MIVDFRDGQAAAERVYWDQASLLAQVGLLDPATLPVTGVEQARHVRGDDQAMNDLLRRRPGVQPPGGASQRPRPQVPRLHPGP